MASRNSTVIAIHASSADCSSSIANLPIRCRAGKHRFGASLEQDAEQEVSGQRQPASSRRTSVSSNAVPGAPALRRSEEHTSELQSLMRISYAVFCLKKKREN